MFPHLHVGLLLTEHPTAPHIITHILNLMYNLWESLSGNIQDKEPFFVLCYADDPLLWGDEEQTRNIYEFIMYYFY